MKILVTGAAGFIGSHLCELLLKDEENEVRGLDNFITGSKENMRGFYKVHPRFSFAKGSVTEKEFLRPHVEWADHVYQLAAPVGVKFIMNNPVHTILDNVRGIDNVLELAHQYNKKVLVASTSEVYGKSLDFLDSTGKRSLSEEDYRIEGSTQNHRWAYANTKALDEFLSLAYYKQYGLKCVIIRFFNTVGPRQSSQYGMVIPNFVSQALKGENITVYGDGSQTRSFLHVFDAVQAITELMITEHAVGQVYNVGNPFEISIKELAERIIEKTNSTSKIRLVSYQEAYGAGFEDMQRRTPNIDKLTRTIGFKIRYDLEAILDSIIEYQKIKLSME